MSVEMPTPRIWLDEQLEKWSISQNELARRAGVAQSQVHEFAEGQSGAETAVRIANALGMSADIPLALLGRVPPPARWSDVKSDEIAHIYRLLDEEDRQTLFNFAEFLRQKHLAGKLRSNAARE